MVAILFFPSCRRKEVKLRMDAIDDRASMPVLDAQEVTTLISDSGVTRFRITSRQWLVFDKAEPSHWAVAPVEESVASSAAWSIMEK